MLEVELGYFEHRYNHKNEKTIVTNINNIDAVGFIIKVGDADDSCNVNIREEMIPVINKVKPSCVMIKEENKEVIDFCGLINIPCEIPNFDYDETVDQDPSLENLNPGWYEGEDSIFPTTDEIVGE